MVGLILSYISMCALAKQVRHILPLGNVRAAFLIPIYLEIQLRFPSVYLVLSLLAALEAKKLGRFLGSGDPISTP